MNKKHRIIAIIYLFLLAVGMQFPSILSADQGTESQPSPIVACAPDRLIVYPKETVTLNAWATSSTGEPLKYLWSADKGTIKGEGPEVTWDFTGVKPGSYNAKVQVTDPQIGTSDCTLSVIVSFPPLDLMGGGYETGRAFLLPDKEEEKGYGLYSYLLLGSEPDASTYERYLNSVIEYLKFPDIARLLEKRYKPKELNITYLPLDMQPDQEVLGELKKKEFKSVAEWVLKHYDYAQARALLRTLPGPRNHREGPYIISSLDPLGKNPLSPPYLYQDQSSVPPNLVSMWMNYFLYQASKERFWDEEAGKLFGIKLRTAIGIAAVGLPEVQKSLDKCISWIERIRKISHKTNEKPT